MNIEPERTWLPDFDRPQGIRAFRPSTRGLIGRRGTTQRTIADMCGVQFESPYLSRLWKDYFKSRPGSQYAADLLATIRRETQR